MDKKMTIGLFGAHINSSNLGCQALTYSLLFLLEQISYENHYSFVYYIFEYCPSEGKTAEVASKLGIHPEAIHCFPIAPIYRPKSFVRHYQENFEMLHRICACDLAIDLTAGDSFSDIYGDSRFRSNTRIKRVVEWLGVPLVLGPQTFGPFLKESNIPLAKAVFKHCPYVIARDRVSAELASRLSGKAVPYTTDLAFQLPYNQREHNNEKIRIGFNISALLIREHVESGIENTLKLKADYDTFVDAVLDHICGTEKYDVILLAHVNEDMEACRKYQTRYPTAQIAPLFTNPIDIKSYISGLDIFIGARMHATIAAFTSGVVTIPTAYSRKFAGLFDVVQYTRVVDLQELSTQEAVALTINNIENRQEIKNEMKNSLKIAESYQMVTKSFFVSAIQNTELRNLRR